MTKAITIDFWNTLVDASGGEARDSCRRNSLRNAMLHVGREISDAEISSAFDKVHERFEHVWKNDRRTLTTDEMVSTMWIHFGVEIPPEQHASVVRDFERSILFGQPKLLAGAKESLAILSRKYVLALISDTAFSPGYVLTELLEGYGVRKYFSAFSFSDETGCSKPDARAFRTVLDQLHVSAVEAIHVGDIERTDIAGAKALAMKAILFRGDTQSLYHSDDYHNTQADAVANSWSEVPGIIERMEHGD